MVGRGMRGTAPSCLKLSLLVAFAILPFVTACSGDAAKYAGKWKRNLSGEGEVEMQLASNGKMELMLPSPRWPDSVDMKVAAAFKGDTLTFKVDTAGSRCQTAEAHYIVTRDGDELRIAGVGMDSCGGRRAALVGRWEKA